VTYQLIYPDYKDLSTGKTLVATPGSAYTIVVAPGRVTSTPAFPNDGRWTSTTAFVAMEFKAPPDDKPVSSAKIADIAAATSTVITGLQPIADVKKEGA
jgi:hypothetical protein